jgi:hypothetical protein
MKLIDELIERHSEVEQRIDARNAQVHEHFQAIEALVKTRVDLDRAIAALNAFRNEDDLDIGYDDDPKPERAHVAEDDAVPAEIISDLTGDPAVEPESGLHGEAVSEEGDAPVTNPEADAIVRAQDWYSPEQVAEREKASRAWSGLGALWGKPKVDA